MPLDLLKDNRLLSRESFKSLDHVTHRTISYDRVLGFITEFAHYLSPKPRGRSSFYSHVERRVAQSRRDLTSRAPCARSTEHHSLMVVSSVQMWKTVLLWPQIIKSR
jgi:hypothetical protein